MCYFRNTSKSSEIMSWFSDRVATDLENVENLENSGNLKNCQNLRGKLRENVEYVA